MMQLKNSEGLIGDTLGTLPVMYDLAILYGGLEVKIHEEISWLYELIPKRYKIKVVDEIDYEKPYLELNIGEAFGFSMENIIYMNQSWHNQVGLPTPGVVVPELNVPDVDVPVYDYIFAPFSRSTPDEQKWPIKNWVELLTEMTKMGFKVAVFGNSKHDNPLAFGNNSVFDKPMIEVINMLKKCRNGCISINTGISHLCYVVGCKNYLLNNQGDGWAVQPNSVSIETYIPRITVTQMLDFIKNN